TEKRDFEHLKVGYSNPSGGTAGEFAEFRIWNRCRSADDIRATANLAMESRAGVSPVSPRDSTLAGETPALLYHGAADSWGRLHGAAHLRSEEHTSELQSRGHLVCRLLLEKKKRGSRSLRRPRLRSCRRRRRS